MECDTLCFICLKASPTHYSHRGGGGEEARSRGDGVQNIFWKFAKDYLQISSVDDDEENIDDDDGSVLSKEYFCEECLPVVNSVGQLYLELVGVRLRLSWKLGELSRLFKRFDRDSSLAEVRILLRRKCAQKARENFPKLATATGPPASSNFTLNQPDNVGGDVVQYIKVDPDQPSSSPAFVGVEDDDIMLNSKWDGQDSHLEQLQEGTDKDTLDIFDSQNIQDNDIASASGSDWCPSDAGGEDSQPQPKSSDDDDDEDDDNQQQTCSDKDSDCSWKWNDNPKPSSSTTSKKRKKKTKSQANNQKAKSFQSPKIFRKEILEGSSSSPSSWDCELCGITTSLKTHHLQLHERNTPTDQKKAQCWFCYKIFALHQSRDYHVKSMHSKMLSKEGNFRCQVEDCDPAEQQKFETVSQLNDHLKTHLPSSEEQETIKCCSICGLGFIDTNFLNLHELLHTKWTRNYKGKARRMLCPACGKDVPNAKHLQNHYNIFHGARLKTIKCSECGALCSSSSGLKCHRKKYHSSNPGKETAKEKIRKLSRQGGPAFCQECGKEVKSKYRLEQHHREVHKQVDCELCGESVIGLLAMREHRVKAHNFRDYTKGEEWESKSCALCPKEFPTRLRLVQHMSQVHSGLEFRCEMCPKVFKGKAQLTQHQRLYHADSKPPICPHCGNTYANQKLLGEHIQRMHPEMMVDDGTRKNKECPYCPEKFRWKAALDKHLLKIHPNEEVTEGILECNVCGMRLPKGKASQMEYHMSTHLTIEERRSGGKLHMCHVCGKEFRTGRFYKNHLKMHEVKLNDDVPPSTQAPG